MKRAGFSVTLILLLLGGLVLAGGAAGDQPEEVRISMWWDGSYTVAAGDTVVITAGWGSCQRGLVHQFMHATIRAIDEAFLSHVLIPFRRVRHSIRINPEAPPDSQVFLRRPGVKIRPVRIPKDVRPLGVGDTNAGRAVLSGCRVSAP